MAQLKLSELSPAGSELFQDSENFLEELSDRELDLVAGGDYVNSVVTKISVTVGSIISYSEVAISPNTFLTSDLNSNLFIITDH